MTSSAGHAAIASGPTRDLAGKGKRDVHWPVRLYAAISLVYIALMAWWVTFFAHQGTTLAGLADAAGAPFGSAQLQVLEEASHNTSRMFLYEGSFVGVLMLASVWLVARGQRQQRALSRRQRNFLSAVTHELRSPIASARLCLDSILMGRTDEQKTQRYLRMARLDLDRLSGMAEDVLATRALSEGRAPLRLETVNLTALVERATVARTERPGGSTVPVRVEAAQPVRVHADPLALGQVLDNLVGNALKYCGDRGEVVITVSRRGSRGILEVTDQGPGLQGVDPKTLTQAFVRGGDEELRTRPGVGLGLYIVQQIVTAHQGELSFFELGSGRRGADRGSSGAADPDSGLTVRVELPLAADSAENPS